MLRPIAAAFSLTLLLLLAACGSGGGGSAAKPAATTTTPASVSSVVAKGLIQGGVITVSRWNNGAYEAVATTRTRNDGGFTVTVPDARAGEVLKLSLGLSTDATQPTRMVCDIDAGCGATHFGESLPLTTALGLTSWVTVDGGGTVTVMPVTPVSTMLVALAESLGGGHLTPESLQVARSRTAALFCMSAQDLLAVPVNVANAPSLLATIDSSPAAARMSLLAAAFAELAGGDVSKMGGVIHDYAQDFADNNGRLMQTNPGVGRSLAAIYQAANTAVSLATSSEAQGWLNGWINAVSAELTEAKLTPICRATTSCEQFDSNRFVKALGTGSGTLGYDLRQVMQQQGATSLEQLIANELGKMGWLASADTSAVAGIALQTALYSGYTLVNLSLPVPIFRLDAMGGLTPVADYTHKTVRVTGSQNGFDVDLTVTLPAAIATMQAEHKVFDIAVKGTVSNSRLRGEIDVVVAIDASETDFTPFINAYSDLLASIFNNQEADLAGLKLAMGGLLKNAKADIVFNARKLRLSKGDSLLAVEGNGHVAFDMAHGESRIVAVEGAVEQGQIVLPNGSRFAVDPAREQSLTFGLGTDGVFAARFSADVLTAMSWNAEGVLRNLGPVITGLRDVVVQGLTTAEGIDLNAFLLQLGANLQALSLKVGADVLLTAFNHHYTLDITDTTLTVTHPDREDIAVTVTLSLSGLLVKAGTAWWQLGVDFSNPSLPALVLMDEMGGAWRWEFALAALQPAAVALQPASSSPGNCYGTARFC